MANRSVCQAAPAAKLPSLAEVRQTISKQLSRDPDYRPGDLIARSQVKTILSGLQSLGWEVADGDKILAATCRDESFLVTTLRSEEGVGLMRQISTMPGGFDRLDRLSRLANGPETVERLIAGPDGFKLLAYMTETRGGNRLGTQLSADPGGEDFNEPTGRIYTASDLYRRLALAHAAAKNSTDTPSGR